MYMYADVLSMKQICCTYTTVLTNEIFELELKSLWVIKFDRIHTQIDLYMWEHSELMFPAATVMTIQRVSHMMKVCTEFNLATWLRMDIFTD